jgi:hypothetical protein
MHPVAGGTVQSGVPPPNDFGRHLGNLRSRSPKAMLAETSTERHEMANDEDNASPVDWKPASDGACKLAVDNAASR